VHFSSTDTQAGLPANSTLTAGVGTFAATLKTVGTQTVAVNDVGTPSLTGTSNSITVSAAAAAKFVVSDVPTSITAGQTVSVTVTAQDAFNNLATTYVG